MQHSFFQRFLLAVFAGFCAACLLWFGRHIVEKSIHDTGDGWKEMYNTPKPKSK